MTNPKSLQNLVPFKPGPDARRHTGQGSRSRPDDRTKVAERLTASLRFVMENASDQIALKAAHQQPMEFLRLVAGIMPKDFQLAAAGHVADAFETFWRQQALMREDAFAERSQPMASDAEEPEAQPAEILCP